MKKTTALVATAAAMIFAAPTNADDYGDFSGCESIPIFGLNPQIRKICDDPINPDGSWMRYRKFVRLSYERSSVGGVYCQGGCPPWMPNDVTPGYISQDAYLLTPDTVPPGEPGHLDNPIRCTPDSLRCS